MRTTITLDDELLAEAGEAMGTNERSLLLHEGLKALIEREAARRLIQLATRSWSASWPVATCRSATYFFA